MFKDLHANAVPQQTLNPATITGSGDYTECDTVDGLNCQSVEHILLVGESGDTWSASLETDVILQHSTDDSTWAAVTDAGHIIESDDMEDLSVGLIKDLDIEADDNAYYRATYVGPYRYSRLYLNRTGNHSSGTPMAAVAILHKRMTGDIAPAS